MTRVATPRAAKIVSDRPPPPACDDDAIRALPSLEILARGSRPTEPGWYVAQDPDGAFTTVYVFGGPECERLFFIGHFGNEAYPPNDNGGFDFIARIYPDRIEQE